MLRLARLRMKNFKSFKQATIPFTKGFTAIAGANGSGKSNILDAVLFALGETSLKSMRAARLTDLVHSGAPAGEHYAVVNLTFEGDGKTYEISRTVDKQGKSVYRINEQRVTLGEVQNLMKELGLRVDGHNLVSQGDLMRIIDMNPVERRELIDEVAGLQEFEEKKKEALKELEKVDRKVKDVNIVLNERMAIIEQLSREREAAQHYQRLAKELQRTKATVLHLESKDLNEKLEQLLGKQVDIIGKKDEALGKQQESRKTIQELDTEFGELDAKVIGVKVGAFEGLGKSVEEHKAEIRVLEERIRQHHARVESIHGQIEHLLQQIQKARDGMHANEAKAGEWETKKKELEQQLAPLRKQQAESAKKRSELLEQAEKLEKEAQSKRDALAEVREKMAHLTARMEGQEKEERMLTGMEERLTLQIERMKKEKESLGKDLHELEKIRKKYPDPAKARTHLSRKLEEIEHHLAEHTGKVLSHAEALEQLKKSKSSCPICERELKHEHKETLAKEKRKHIEEAEKAARKAEEERKTLREEWEEFHASETLLTRLEKSQAHARQLEEEIRLVEGEKEGITKKRHALSPRAFTEEKTRLEGERSTHQMAHEKAEKALHEHRLKLNQVAMDHQLGSLNAELQQVENDLYRNRMERGMQEQSVTQTNGRISALKEEEKNEKERMGAEEKKRGEMEKILKEAEGKYEKVLGANQTILDKRERVQQKLVVEREKERAWQEKSFRLEGQWSENKIEQSKYDTRLLDVKEELKNFIDVKTLDEKDVTLLRKNIPVLEHQVKQLGTVNMKSLEDFGQYEKDVMEIREKSQKLEEERLAVMDLINGIDIKRTEAFMETFHSISQNFNKLYTGFFNGEAKLELTEPNRPLEAGLLIEARHGTEKSLKNIDSMSGGEKSLTSLAFIFSIQLYEPAPFYFFDEVDAALDMTNSRKVGNLIQEMSKSSQFISITHNDQVVKAADQIIGVAKSNTNSSVIGIRPGEKGGFTPASESSTGEGPSIHS
ncbi:MAG: chromosome segregation SMC family protein [archaeon]